MTFDLTLITEWRIRRWHGWCPQTRRHSASRWTTPSWICAVHPDACRCRGTRTRWWLWGKNRQMFYTWLKEGKVMWLSRNSRQVWEQTQFNIHLAQAGQDLPGPLKPPKIFTYDSYSSFQLIPWDCSAAVWSLTSSDITNEAICAVSSSPLRRKRPPGSIHTVTPTGWHFWKRGEPLYICSLKWPFFKLLQSGWIQDLIFSNTVQTQHMLRCWTVVKFGSSPAVWGGPFSPEDSAGTYLRPFHSREEPTRQRRRYCWGHQEETGWHFSAPAAGWAPEPETHRQRIAWPLGSPG